MYSKSTSSDNLQKAFDDLIAKLNKALNSYRPSTDSETFVWLENVLDSLHCWLLDIGNDSKVLRHFEQTPLGVHIQTCLFDITSQLDIEIQSKPHAESGDQKSAQDQPVARYVPEYQTQVLSRSTVTNAIVQLQDASEAIVTFLAAYHDSGPLKNLKSEIDRIHESVQNVSTTELARGELGKALYTASKFGHERVVQILLDDGADINAQGGEYGNALQAASRNGHKKVVQMLLDKGAEVNAQGGWYGNALEAASWRGYEDVVRILLNKGAKVNARGGWFGTALDAASRCGHKHVVKLLLNAGAIRLSEI